MTQRGRGRAGTPRVPLRGFASLLKDLPPVIKNRVEMAFAEAENLLDFHNRSVPDLQTKRKPSGLIEIPIITTESSILGGSVKWPRLSDPRITLYEVQTDTVNVFPNPSSYTVLETFFAIENVTSDIFVRVRGVRQDGTAGNWSETGTIEPTSTAPTAHTFVFYQGYLNPQSEPALEIYKRYDGTGSPNDFYTLFEAEIDAQDRATGGMMIWSYISNRLTDYAEEDAFAWDRVRMLVNGVARFDHLASLTSRIGTLGPGLGSSGISFYSRDGYTATMGPWVEEYPGYDRGQGPQDAHLAADDASGGSVAWTDPDAVRRPSPPFKYPSVEAEASLGVGAVSHFLKLQDFKFDIPKDATILGVKVQVKRKNATGNTTAIKDSSVRLLNAEGMSVGDDKARTDLWPVVDDDTNYGGNVIPAKTHAGIAGPTSRLMTLAHGYTEYGGETDLWNHPWSFYQINSSNFGLRIAATNTGATAPAKARVDHAKVSVYYNEFYQRRRFNVKLQASVINYFYHPREVFGGLINAIEFGELLE
jgi:hypothetical protein